MSIICCKHQSAKYPRQRCNPTFIHEPIFLDQISSNYSVRYTPTFYSTALDTEGYNIKTLHKKSHQLNSSIEKVVYSNYSHERRIEDLNPKSKVLYTSKYEWHDHTKQQLIQKMRGCNHKYQSKQRKNVDLSSDPVFTDFNYGPSQINNLIKTAPQKVIQKQSEPLELNQNPQTSNLNAEQILKIKKKQSHEEQKADKILDVAKKQNGKTNTKKDFHKNCTLHQIDRQKRNSISKISRPSSTSNVVSSNPTFTLVRGNKICNKL